MNFDADLSILRLLLLVSPVAAFCWWMGYIATKRMRLEKNKAREPAIQRALAKKEQLAEQQATTEKEDHQTHEEKPHV